MSVELTVVRDVLAAHPPWRRLPAAVRETLPARMRMRYFRRGSVILAAGQVAEEVALLRSGAVDITDANGTLVERGDEGTTFGVSSARDGKPSRYTMTALEDSLVLTLPAADFRELLAGDDDFNRFFADQSAVRMRAAAEAVAPPGAGRDVLRTPLAEVVRREPVAVEATETIRDAARLMTREGVSALLVTRAGRLAGIVTDRDMRRRVVAEEHPADRPVATIMTADPTVTTPGATAVEAMLTMMQRGFHHLPVVADGRPVGMITSGDLMRLQQGNPVALVGAIETCDSLETLIEARGRLPAVVHDLVRADATAVEIGRVITAVADAVTRTLIRLTEAEIGPPPGPYAWVALGSQGRREMVLSSDQDHALILPDDLPEADRGWYGRLAGRVTEGLASCGQALCPGDIMASNPAWRLTRGQWLGVFRGWIAEPDADAVLHADTFFDMRPVTGSSIAEPLLAAVRRDSGSNPRFLARLASEAVRWQPPLGFFRGFVLDRTGERSRGLDLKAGGIAALVQIARIHALAGGIAEVGTQARLTAAAASGTLSQERAEDLRAAHELICMLRARHQVALARAGQAADNVIDPTPLSTIDRHGLRSAFRLVREAQQEVAYTYRLHAVM